MTKKRRNDDRGTEWPANLDISARLAARALRAAGVPYTVEELTTAARMAQQVMSTGPDVPPAVDLSGFGVAVALFHLLAGKRAANGHDLTPEEVQTWYLQTAAIAFCFGWQAGLTAAMRAVTVIQPQERVQ